jgi:hypothetical protein
MKQLDQQYLANRYYSGIDQKKGFKNKLKRLLYFRFARKFAKKAKKGITKTMKGMGQEAKETKEMANSFFRLLESKLDLQNRKTPPSPEEVKAAIEQLKDLGRFSVFTTVSILPGGGFSLIGLELLARKFGIKSFTFIPSAFRKKDAGNENKASDQSSKNSINRDGGENKNSV